ncbi:hypothetical protein [Mycolicibacterium lutetiense]|uniref:ABC-type multidrug transport system permease subunit n=1 Tax=Mycolicibacterium lutetiense TaxID=1641992 RepID=A0ABS4ZU07_9MYCO|nr:hypothetical protein [Mycolicibacterium lutetiense]MBP2453002.1 ABC-type multidrug transport system permease subunit [Mycolicibacterium lutetiense]
MTEPTAASINWVRATMWGAALGGAFWAIVMRCIVADDGPSSARMLGIVAIVALATVGVGGLVFKFSHWRTAAAAIILAPLTGWVAILIYIVV